jgi:hypothetical protein
MRFVRVGICAMLIGAAVRPAAAQSHYDFNVLYSGGGNATLAPGSQDPTGLNILPLDDFLWTITATAGSFWHVDAGGDFFPLMAFGVTEGGDRYGDFTLTLFRAGSSVFSQVESGALNCYAHMGTNTVSLATGLDFDKMMLSYTLTSELGDDSDSCGSPINDPPKGDGSAKVPGDSHIDSGLLPIFGAPEENAHSPGISFQSAAVTSAPEPATISLVAFGLTLVGGGVRRRNRRLAR